jgi:hypothetical protein
LNEPWIQRKENKKANIMLEQAKQFVIEYSITKDETQVRSVEEMLESNLHNIARNISSDYLPVGLYKTRSQAKVGEIEFRSRLDAAILSRSRGFRHISEVLEAMLPELLSKLDDAGPTN